MNKMGKFGNSSNTLPVKTGGTAAKTQKMVQQNKIVLPHHLLQVSLHNIREGYR